MRVLRSLKRSLVEKPLQFIGDVSEIRRMLTDPNLSQTYFPEEERKSRQRIFADLFWWLVRNGEVNEYYFLFGFDRKQGVDMGDYLPYNDFRRIRNRRNLHPKFAGRYNYVCLLGDKFVFAQFVSSLGFPTAKILALCDPQSIVWLNPRRTASLESLIEGVDRDLDAFCKPLAGIGGGGAFSLKVSSGKLFMNDKAATLDQLREKLAEKYLIQERIKQHPEMSALHPDSINTIRLVTFNNDGDIKLLSAALRIGAKGNKVDNWASGGILVGINEEEGKLQGAGLFKPGVGGRVWRHPDTLVSFEGFEVPYFKEAVRLASDLHEYLYGVHSIGWDIGVTEAGPVLIEGNDSWEWGIPMALDRNFKQKFLSMYRDEPVV